MRFTSSGVNASKVTRGWSVEHVLALRRMLRALRTDLDAALVLVATGEHVLDYVGDEAARPSTLSTLHDGPEPSLTYRRTRDGEHRAVVSARVRPGFGIKPMLVLVTDPIPAEMAQVVDILVPVVEQLEDLVLGASWPVGV